MSNTYNSENIMKHIVIMKSNIEIHNTYNIENIMKHIFIMKSNIEIHSKPNSNIQRLVKHCIDKIVIIEVVAVAVLKNRCVYHNISQIYHN